MKKLGKLSISPEKVMKNEELVNLRGGYLNGTGSLITCYGHAGRVIASFCYVCCEDESTLCKGAFYGTRTISNACGD